MKMIEEEYRLSKEELSTLLNRMLADDKEFEKVWKLYKEKTRTFRKGVDPFSALLSELVS